MYSVKCVPTVVLVAVASLFCGAVISAPGHSIEQNPEQSQFVKPESIQGCYELGALNWKPDLQLDKDEAAFIRPPERIEILAEHGGMEPWASKTNGYLLRPAPGSPKNGVHRFSYWYPTGPKAIEVVFSTGASGLVMQLKVDGDMLRGKAKTHWDFPRKIQTAQVNARKTGCGAGPS